MYFVESTLVIGKKISNEIQMLGTGFILNKDGLMVTSNHVIAGLENNLFAILPNIKSLNEYQDTTDNSCEAIELEIIDIDPFRDIALLKLKISSPLIENNNRFPKLGSFDEISIGETLTILGFPHCVDGRKVLTFQEATLGAKILLESNGIKTKHGVINTQTRPGQSGSIVYSRRLNKVVGILIGAYLPSSTGISIGGISPKELHQTTHCVSCEYIIEMMEE